MWNDSSWQVGAGRMSKMGTGSGISVEICATRLGDSEVVVVHHLDSNSCLTRCHQ